jgi:hypothetical protein
MFLNIQKRCFILLHTIFSFFRKIILKKFSISKNNIICAKAAMVATCGFFPPIWRRLYDLPLSQSASGFFFSNNLSCSHNGDPP